MTYTIAHRGLSAVHLENSLEAIIAALEYTSVVEIDVRCTHDAKPVCIHDPSLKRTIGLDRKIGQLKLDELKQVAPKIVLLDDALDAIAERDGGVMLDVKVSRPRGIAAIELTLKRSRFRWNDGRQLRRGEPIDALTATFQSADAQLLQAFRSRTGAGCLELVRSESTVRELILGAPFITAYAQGVTLPDALATSAALRILRSVRLGSYVYTVNNQSRFEQLADAGVSGVYTDDVSRIG